jgi:hypothetical protein
MSKSLKKSSELSGENKSVEKIPQKKISTGKTAKQLMNKHIQDENDVITEEDFKNMKIDLDISGDTAHQPIEIVDDPERPKDEDKDPKVTTPWDVIS